MNIPIEGSALTKINGHLSTLKVVPRNIPNMTVAVEPGGAWFNENIYAECVGLPSPVITAPTVIGEYKWVIVCFHISEEIRLIEGTSAITPTSPTILANYLPLAAIYVSEGDTTIINDQIYDVRPIFASGTFANIHTALPDITDPNAHPISSITDLQTELDNKVLTTTYTTGLATKCDWDGTTAEAFKLNKDSTGPNSDAYLTVERGGTDVHIRWNEISDQWEFTNDGAVWLDMASGGVVSLFGLSEVTPTNFTGTTEGDVLIVNATTDALEFGTPTITSSIFDLTDVNETDFTSTAQGDVLAVNAGTDALEFVTPSPAINTADVTKWYTGTSNPIQSFGETGDYFHRTDTDVILCKSTIIGYSSDLLTGGTLTSVNVYNPTNAIDGNNATNATCSAVNSYIQYEFAITQQVERVRFYNNGAGNYQSVGWKITSSTSGNFAADEVIHVANTGSVSSGWYNFDFVNSLSYKYWRFYSLKSSNALISELQMLSINMDWEEVGSISDSVFGLTDVSETNFTGTSQGDILSVNSSTDALEFVTPISVTSIFDLSDVVPTDFTGTSAGDMVVVNPATNGLIFSALPISGGEWATSIGTPISGENFDWSLNLSDGSIWRKNILIDDWSTNQLSPSSTCVVSSIYSGSASNVIDGSDSSYWQSSQYISGYEWWGVDFGLANEKEIGKVDILVDYHFFHADVIIQGTNDTNADWNAKVWDTLSNMVSLFDGTREIVLSVIDEYRYYRVYSTYATASRMRLNEIEMFTNIGSDYDWQEIKGNSVFDLNDVEETTFSGTSQGDILAVNAGTDAFEFITPVTSVFGLTDISETNFTGTSEGDILAVNAGTDALEFITPSSVTSIFDLSDVNETDFSTSSVGDVLAVNSGRTSLEWTTVAPDVTWFSGSGVPLTSLGSNYDYYQDTDSGELYCKSNQSIIPTGLGSTSSTVTPITLTSQSEAVDGTCVNFGGLNYSMGIDLTVDLPISEVSCIIGSTGEVASYIAAANIYYSTNNIDWTIVSNQSWSNTTTSPDNFCSGSSKGRATVSFDEVSARYWKCHSTYRPYLVEFETNSADTMTWEVIAAAKNSLNETSAPTIDNDNTEGYSVSSKWIDQTNNNMYFCFDASIGAAQWELIINSSLFNLSEVDETDFTGTIQGDILAVNAGTDALEFITPDYYSSGNTILASDGTVSVPGLSFNSDTNCGVYRIGADNIGFVVNGARVFDISTVGFLLGSGSRITSVINDDTMATASDTTLATSESIKTYVDTEAPTISSGTTAPSSTPDKIGDIYVNTTGTTMYVATGTSSSSDWTAVN